jgi:leader peptidase (prepilin peptidase)/N-methyltransferase
VTPRSRCRNCGHVIRWYENIPVLSFLVLRGKCSECKTPIGLRYPVVEVITAPCSPCAPGAGA